jgi:hypothetical protein
MVIRNARHFSLISKFRRLPAVQERPPGELRTRHHVGSRFSGLLRFSLDHIQTEAGNTTCLQVLWHAMISNDPDLLPVCSKKQQQNCGNKLRPAIRSMHLSSTTR